MSVSWAEVRAQFPAVDECTYLNTAAGAPISVVSAAAGRDYYEATLRDGDVHWDEWLERVEAVRGVAARFIGAEAREVGFVSNASSGLNLVAGMLRGRGRVLVARGDFPSVTLPWLQQGFDVEFVDPGDSGGVTLDTLRAALTPDTGVLALGQVHYRTGYRYDLSELGAFCREHGIVLVIDATQGLGAMQVNLAAGEVDFLVASGYKWLTAGYSIGLLYVNSRHLDTARFPAVGWRSARDPYALVSDRLDLAAAAGALELGHPPFAGVFSLGAALELFAGLGADAVQERVLQLNDHLVAGLAGRGLKVLGAAARSRRSGIVYVSQARAAAAERKSALAAHGVLVSARGEGIRVSAHCYNNRADIDAFLEAWDAISASSGGQ